MSGPLSGITVLEVAMYGFVPSAGAVLADWGADVIKVEHAVTGDPQRGLRRVGPFVVEGEPNPNVEHANRGKRSIGIDMSVAAGRELILQLAEGADVFLTSFLPQARVKFGIDVDDIRAVNPSIIYVRGSGQGVRGPDADKGGYDGSSFWARSGVADALTQFPGDVYGPNQPPAIADLAGAQTIAGGIAAALFKRERTGETSVVDVSLLGLGAWMMSPNIIAHKVFADVPSPSFTRADAPNPIANRYRTKDDRVVHLVMLQAVKYWPELITAVGRPDLANDPRFTDPRAMFEHRAEAVAVLDEVFATRTLAEWRVALNDIDGVWAPAQKAIEMHDDVQVIANGYIDPVVESSDGGSFPLVVNPVQFDEAPTKLVRAPDAGEHTDAILAELGLDWDRIVELKVSGAVL